MSETHVQALEPAPGSDTPTISLEQDLLAIDLDAEGLVHCMKTAPLSTLRAVLFGRGDWREYVRQNHSPDPSALPYVENVIADVRGKAERGQMTALSTSGHPQAASSISMHLGIFNKVIHAQAPARQTPRLKATLPRFHWSLFLRVLRAHQWAKNLLLFVPALTAHRFDIATIGLILLALVAFSLCASSVYIINDLIDLESDRRHPTKKARPFASGECGVLTGAVLAPVLLIMSLGLALLVSANFGLALLGYFALTTAYTFYLKSKLVIDVIVLAMLYTGRILAGGLAAGIVVSHWLLAFSMFIFTSLALMKRYVELSTLVANNLPDPQNRNYRATDLPIVAAVAAATSMNAVTIFALYIFAGTDVAYSRPWALWLICPLLLYWLARALVMAHRLEMNEDPVLFALKDRTSRMVLACTIILVLFAI